MKRILYIIVLSCFVSATWAQSSKKGKKLDSYYINEQSEVCRYDQASYHVLVQQVADSIKMYTSFIGNDVLYKLETFRVLNDSVEEKWGTQQLFYFDGKLHMHQFIDPEIGTDTQVIFGPEGNKEREIILDKISGESSVVLYYDNGAKKSLTKTIRDVLGNEKTDYTVWLENGRMARTQRLENQRTIYLNMFDDLGNLCLKMPFEQNDTIFLTNEMNATTRYNAKSYGLINIDGDSLKFVLHNMSGRPLGVQNFKTYTPEEVTVWGVQKLYYTTTAQPTDSIVQFCSIDGEALVEHKYYQEGKLMSSKTVSLDPVHVKDVELRQYYPSGILRRIQKKHDDKLVEGHVYDAQGNETFPFYEFVE